MNMKKYTLFILLVAISVSFTTAQTDSIADIFRNTEVKVLLPSDYILNGTKVEAEILLIQSDSNMKAKAAITGWKTIELKGGKANYTTIAFGEGKKRIEGYVDYFVGDRYKRLPFSKEYIVFKGANIFANRMDVLYTGIENPVTINVPGYSNNEIKVIVTNGSVTKDKKRGYVVTVAKRGKAKITVAAKNEDGKYINVGSAEFRVRNPPRLHALMATLPNGGTYDIVALKKYIKNVPKVFIGVGEGFPYEKLNFTVASYTFSLYKANGENPAPIEVSGQVLTPEILTLVEAMEKGDKIIIDNIKVAAPDEKWSTSPVVVTAK